MSVHSAYCNIRILSPPSVGFGANAKPLATPTLQNTAANPCQGGVEDEALHKYLFIVARFGGESTKTSYKKDSFRRPTALTGSWPAVSLQQPRGYRTEGWETRGFNKMKWKWSLSNLRPGTVGMDGSAIHIPRI